MKFQYHNPSHFTFGPDSLELLPELCQGRKVLLVCGGGGGESTWRGIRKNPHGDERGRAAVWHYHCQGIFELSGTGV